MNFQAEKQLLMRNVVERRLENLGQPLQVLTAKELQMDYGRVTAVPTSQSLHYQVKLEGGKFAYSLWIMEGDFGDDFCGEHVNKEQETLRRDSIPFDAGVHIFDFGWTFISELLPNSFLQIESTEELQGLMENFVEGFWNPQTILHLKMEKGCKR